MSGGMVRDVFIGFTFELIWVRNVDVNIRGGRIRPFNGIWNPILYPADRVRRI